MQICLIFVGTQHSECWGHVISKQSQISCQIHGSFKEVKYQYSISQYRFSDIDFLGILCVVPLIPINIFCISVSELLIVYATGQSKRPIIYRKKYFFMKLLRLNVPQFSVRVMCNDLQNKLYFMFQEIMHVFSLTRCFDKTDFVVFLNEFSSVPTDSTKNGHETKLVDKF